MGQNSKAKRDKKKLKAKNSLKSNTQQISSNPIKLQQQIDALFDPTKLTTPKGINDDIRKFCRKISKNEPIFIAVTPEPWSRQSCCDSNVAEYIKHHGGKVVCGYKLWGHAPVYLEGERHAVWFKDGEFRDISFNADGETLILFVPDEEEKQKELESNDLRKRWGKDSVTKQLIKIVEQGERRMLKRTLSKEESWQKMLTYEQWLSGERMPSLFEERIL